MGAIGTIEAVTSWMEAYVRSWRERGKHDDPVFDVRPYRRKRTLNQNSYYWVLLGKLAARLGISHDECHRWMILSYAPYAVMTVLQEVPVERFCDYCDTVKENIVANGKTWKNVRVYTGSSKMDSAEFSRLLEGMIQECHQQGIETMTPEEIAALEYAGVA